MSNWKDALKYDPIKPLLETENEAILYHVKKDLLNEEADPVEGLWELAHVKKILRKQQDNGSWKFAGKSKESIQVQENYAQVETFRQLGYLICKYGLNKTHPSIEKAVEFLFKKQTEEGDIRGIYGTQYTPNYTAMMLELIILAGYEDDPRVKKTLDWLLSVRQDNGGWAISMRTNNLKWHEFYKKKEPIPTNRAKPHAHLITGAVIRPLAIHPEYNKRKEVIQAGKLLAERIFENDKYPDKRDKSHWTKFTFPFWFNDLISAMTALGNLKFSRSEPKIQESLNWFIEQQENDGSWNVKILRAGGDKEIKHWMSLNICRIFKKFYI